MFRTLVFYFFQGVAYGMLSVGLVLVYRASRVLNVAQAEFGTVSAYLTFLFFEHLGWPYAIAAGVAVAAVVLLGLSAERVVVRPLRDGSAATRLLAVAAVALSLIAAEAVVAGAGARELRPAVSGAPLGLLGARIFPQQLLLLGLAVLTVAAAVAFRRSRWGSSFVALSSDRTAALAAGISERRISRLVWGSAALIGAVVGLMQGPIIGVAPAFLTALPGGALVPALVGALIGGMESLVPAFLGGVLVGLIQGVGAHVLGSHVPGAQDLTVFLLLLVVLSVRPQGWPSLLGRQVA